MGNLIKEAKLMQLRAGIINEDQYQDAINEAEDKAAGGVQDLIKALRDYTTKLSQNKLKVNGAEAQQLMKMINAAMTGAGTDKNVSTQLTTVANMATKQLVPKAPPPPPPSGGGNKALTPAQMKAKGIPPPPTGGSNKALTPDQMKAKGIPTPPPSGKGVPPPTWHLKGKTPPKPPKAAAPPTTPLKPPPPRKK